ncbi:MAG: hypothetical protein IJ737_03960 [Ruminococcus sp.]|nr:hypothetical protein [Ruminococcus sp.]
MNYRCKFCGYRFKDNDECICPECLTAREEDISCGAFAVEDHSHERFGDGLFSAGRNNDTFRDGNDSFLREERREESHTNAANYERHNGGDISPTGGSYQQPRQFVPQTPQQNNFVPQSYQRPSLNGFPPPTVPKKNNSAASGCVALIVILFFVFFFIIAIIGESSDGDDDEYEYECAGYHVSVDGESALYE